MIRKAILAIVLILLAAASVTATTISGTFVNGAAVGVTGTLYLSLSQQSVQLSTGGCGGPAVVVPTMQVQIAVTAGTVPGTTIIGNDCIAPPGTYYIVQFNDTQGNTVFKQNWQIAGASMNVGNISPILVPQGTVSIGTIFVTNLNVSGTCTISSAVCGAFLLSSPNTWSAPQSFSAGGTTAGTWNHSGTHTFAGSQTNFNNVVFLNSETLVAASQEFTWMEGGLTTATSGQDMCRGDSTAHALMCSYNGNPFLREMQVVTATLTTTSASSDNVSVVGMTSTGHCLLEPTNATAATDSTGTYVSAKTTDQITVTHPTNSGRTWDVTCTPQ